MTQRAVIGQNFARGSLRVIAAEEYETKQEDNLHIFRLGFAALVFELKWLANARIFAGEKIQIYKYLYFNK